MGVIICPLSNTIQFCLICSTHQAVRACCGRIVCSVLILYPLCLTVCRPTKHLPRYSARRDMLVTRRVRMGISGTLGQLIPARTIIYIRCLRFFNVNPQTRRYRIEGYQLIPLCDGFHLPARIQQSCCLQLKPARYCYTFFILKSHG